MGGHRRAIPAEGACEMSEYDDGVQLVVELGNRLFDAVHGRYGSCQSAVEGLLRLGQLLLRVHRFCVSLARNHFLISPSEN